MLTRTIKHRRKITGDTKDELVRFVALGGLEEVGRNMMFFEYKDEIIVIDMGLQFPEEDTPGIDYIIPNVNCLESKKQNIKAVILTHAHYDHIGAIPYLIEKLGNPPIYTTALTKEIIVKRQGEFVNAPKLNVEIVKNRDKVKLSRYFEAEFFGVSHTIPDTTGVILRTPVGNMVHFAEMKFDYDRSGKPQGLDEFERIGKMGIHTLFLDSTNAEEPGYSISERVVEKNLEDLIKKAEGRIIIGIFASLLTRMAEIIKIAEKYDRKIALSGLSMKTNVQIAQNLGYIKIKKGVIISLEEIHKYPDEKILVLSTGAQGEPNASLVRIANGENRHIAIKPGDAVIFSSSVIPGNERAVQTLKDNLARQGAKVHHSKLVDLHSSGHAPQEELKVIMKLVKPKFLLPIHGHYFMRALNAELAQEVGIDKKNIFLIDNGQVVEIYKDRVKMTEHTVPAYYVMVDGLGVGDVGEVVIRDRRVLAQEGMVVVIATLDRHSGRFLKNPDIISRGFIYLRENKELVEEVRKKIKGLISRIPRHQTVEPDYVKSLMRDQVGRFLYNKTKRRPMILPVIIEV
ncbi:MAG: ribonuclease J [Patescibacteria group bacterium]